MMGKLDWIIAGGVGLAIGLTVVGLMLFYTGIYSPIKYEASNVLSYSRNGLRVAESASGGGFADWSGGYYGLRVHGMYQLQPTMIDFEVEPTINPITETRERQLK